MRHTYKKKIFLYFLLVFSLFTIVIITVQQNRERTYKAENFKMKMDAYTEILSRYIQEHHLSASSCLDSLNQILPLLPAHLRVTILNEKGKVLFDNDVDFSRTQENHLNRPEISNAFIKGKAGNVRQSATTGISYYYYARHVNHYFIRVALPYNANLQASLKADDLFTYFILLLFFSTLLLLLFLADRLGRAITGLHDFIASAENGRPEYDKIQFPETELGEIGHKIVSNYKMLEDSRNQLTQEQEKLLRHFHYSEEGICIFSANHQKIYANTHFIQYLNTILDKPTFDVASCLQHPAFHELKAFLMQYTPVNPQTKSLPLWQGKITRNGKYYTVKLLIFTDNSYEITLNNISNAEKNRLLKQEMTNNIAHELKTPVSSIRGYLETIIEQPGIAPEKQKFFLERAFSQVLRLSDLIRDVALITKTEEAAELFDKEKIGIVNTIQEVLNDLESSLRHHHITVHYHVSPEVKIEGNHTLLYSIFRNLIDNVISYAGENTAIGIDQYAEDEEYFYFSFYDTGQGVEDTYLERIFDRFYRIGEGRSRKTGGSGLGLSIVKNAVFFHKGQISAKNHKNGGLEFIFSLRKQ